jgi:hypothetical protein
MDGKMNYKTKYDSYKIGTLPEGCKLCVRGEKAVVFVTGRCSRGCKFCPLSNLRKNTDISYANEKSIISDKDLINEIKISNAKGCSLTGGDPLLTLERTLHLAKILKKEFGNKFHIHIYLSTKLVDKSNLEELSRYIDEVRFHPDLDKPLKQETTKIALAKEFWKRKNIGIELPLFPDKKDKIFKFIKEVYPLISFVNLNELEVGEFSEKFMSRKYKLNKDGYTIQKSIKTGEDLLKKIRKERLNLSVHLCTARLKNWHQYQNRLRNYSRPRFFKKMDEGTSVYFSTKDEMVKTFLKEKDYFFDKRKSQFVLNPKKVNKLKNEIKIKRIEEYPTYDREEAETEDLI